MIAKIVIYGNIPLLIYYLSIAAAEKISRMIILIQITFLVLLSSNHGKVSNNHGQHLDLSGNNSRMDSVE